ncbi:synaptic vesicle 2-related protein-like [Bolinopsis microptera]|uniref:synaptic vesicle 2-related protein-like n=1 Tax=Bolinopsis microptera TaxID=2820187 RepID=UPI00307B0370
MDKLLLIFGVVINLGDGMEIYLPGVITQQVSCEIELSPWKEAILDCIQYSTLAVAVAFSGILAHRFGCRVLTLFSLYLSAISTVACAIVANYTTLLISRALIGFSLGLNFSVHSVLIAELISSKKVLDEMVMALFITYSVGGMWSAILGYLLLDVVGWRIFILLTSLPFFIPPIFMLHFSSALTSGQKTGQTVNEQNQKEEKETVSATVPNFVARTTKLGLFGFVVFFQGWLTILLVPTLIQAFKTKEAEPNSDCSVTVTQGKELLLLALVTFAAILGRLFMHFTRKKFNFRKFQVIVAILNVASFGGMLAQDHLAVVVTTNFIVKFLYGVTGMAKGYILYDIDYFGAEMFALGSSVSLAMNLVGGAVGTAMVAFAPLPSVIITALVLSALQILVVLSMTEVQ